MNLTYASTFTLNVYINCGCASMICDVGCGGLLQLKQGRATVTVPFLDLITITPHYAEDIMEQLAYRSIIVIANVTERATGKTLSGNSTAQCMRNLYSLEFLDVSPDSYKPGLDYTGYVMLTPLLIFLLFVCLIYYKIVHNNHL